MLLVSRVLLLPPVASQVRFMRNRAMLLPIFGIGVTALSLCAIAKAEEHGCTLEIPAIVVLPDYNLVRELGPSAFTLQGKHGSGTVTSVETRSGPRRILFVVETGKQVPAAAKKIEFDVISAILANADGEDSFALLASRGPRNEVGFGTNKETVAASAAAIENVVGTRSQKGGVLDSILEAIDRFQSPREGDAIVVLTLGIESDHYAGYGKVRDALAKAHVRLFGVQLGPIIDAIGAAPSYWGNYYQPGWMDPNRENLFALTRASGGFAGWENTVGGPHNRYNLTNDRQIAIKHIALQIYRAIARYYSIRVENPSSNFALELADSVRKDLPQARLNYPDRYWECKPTPPVQLGAASR